MSDRTDQISTNQEELRQRLVLLLEQLAPDEGYNVSRIPEIRFLRSNRPLKSTPVLYDPGIVIVCQGRKRGFFGDRVYVYDEQHYLAVSVPLPFEMETDASEDRPLLAIYMHLDFALAADIMLRIDQLGTGPQAAPTSMMSSPMDLRLSESVHRFLEVMLNKAEAQILGPAMVAEIYFRVLTGEQGSSMRAAVAMQGQFGKVARALRKIHASYNVNLSVDQLAAEAGMSVPTFHTHFKSVTNTSPIQYLKSTRLHQARLLMVRDDMTAALASAEVGYESPSQFSREFKRFFGRSPAQEAKHMRHFALPAPQESSIYVSSH